MAEILIIELKILCKLFSYRTIDLKYSNSVCPFPLNFQDYTLMLIKKPIHTKRKTNLKVPDFYIYLLYSSMNYNLNYTQTKIECI